jgi:hypothetical protein
MPRRPRPRCRASSADGCGAGLGSLPPASGARAGSPRRAASRASVDRDTAIVVAAGAVAMPPAVVASGPAVAGAWRAERQAAGPVAGRHQPPLGERPGGRGAAVAVGRADEGRRRRGGAPRRRGCPQRRPRTSGEGVGAAAATAARADAVTGAGAACDRPVELGVTVAASVALVAPSAVVPSPVAATDRSRSTRSWRRWSCRSRAAGRSGSRSSAGSPPGARASCSWCRDPTRAGRRRRFAPVSPVAGEVDPSSAAGRRRPAGVRGGRASSRWTRRPPPWARRSLTSVRRSRRSWSRSQSSTSRNRRPWRPSCRIVDASVALVASAADAAPRTRRAARSQQGGHHRPEGRGSDVDAATD